VGKKICKREREIVLAGVVKRLRENLDQWKPKGDSCHIYSAPKSALIFLSSKLFSYQVRAVNKHFDFGLFSGAIDIWLAMNPQVIFFLNALDKNYYARPFHGHDTFLPYPPQDFLSTL
jgi:hypothetical protein